MSDQENNEKEYHPQVIPPPEDFDFDDGPDTEFDEEYCITCGNCGEEIEVEDIVYIEDIMTMGRVVCPKCFIKDYPESKYK